MCLSCPIFFGKFFSEKSDNFGTCPKIGELRIGQLRYILDATSTVFIVYEPKIIQF